MKKSNHEDILYQIDEKVETLSHTINMIERYGEDIDDIGDLNVANLCRAVVKRYDGKLRTTIKALERSVDDSIIKHYR